MRLFPPVLLSSVVLLSGCALVGDGVDHRVYEGQVPEYGPLDSVSEVAWEWELEPSEDVHSIQAGLSGPVLELGNGVVALDAQSGEELWHYRSEDRGLDKAVATPDRERVVLSYRDTEGGPAHVVVLETGTGEVEHEYELPDADAEKPWQDRITDEVLVLGDGDALRGVSLSDGQDVWTYEAPASSDGLELISGRSELSVVDDAVVLTHGYSDEPEPDDEPQSRRLVTTALSPGTGEPLWEVESQQPFSNHLLLDQQVSEGGEVLLLEPLGADELEYDPFLLEVESGERIDGEVFEGDVSDDERVALTDEGSVSAEWLPDEDAVEYRHVSFDGETLNEALVPARPSEMRSDPGVVLGEGVLRLSHLTVPDLDRGPVEAEFVEWGSEGEPASIEVGLTENRDEWRQAEFDFSSDVDAPRMWEVPGAVVVTEDDGIGNNVVVGLN